MPQVGELSLEGAPVLATFQKLSGHLDSFSAKLATKTQGLHTLAESAKGAGKAIGSFLTDLAVVTAPVTVIVGLAAGFAALAKSSVDLGGTLNDLGTRTGESVGDLVILREAFEETGIGADNTETFLLKLQDSISGVNEEGKNTAGSLKALGLSAGELRNLPAIGQIQKLQEGFAKLDQTTKVQVARDLFGKSGGTALSLLGDTGALDDARKAGGPLADIAQTAVPALDKLGDTVGALKLDFHEFMFGALSKIAPAATDISSALGGIDFVGIGEGVGTIAAAFLRLADLLVGPLAKGINWISEALSKIVGSSSTASAGLADKYRGFAKLNRDSGARPEEEKASISALQKVGGGGGFGGSDPLLSESRRQTGLLQRIADGMGRMGGAPGGGDPVPV